MVEASSRETKAKLEVMAHFDREASEFDFDRTTPGYRLRHTLVRNLFFNRYRLGDLAFDLGCGTGEYTLSLAQAGFDVVGGDISQGMLTVAKSKVKEHKLAKRIQIVRLESTKLPFRKETFNLIACIAVLDWVPDSHRLLVEAHRVLRHRAALIVCVDALWSLYRIYRIIELAVRRREKRYARVFNYVELKRTLTARGFVVDKFFGDVLLGQVIARWLYEPRRNVPATKVLNVTQPVDRQLTRLPLFKSLSEHYIIEATKK